VFLGCCGAIQLPPPPSPPPTTDPSCSAHPACAALSLTGDCCPTVDDVFLGCCADAPPPTQASCSAHPACAALSLTGDCCPTVDDVFLGCCSSAQLPPPPPTESQLGGDSASVGAGSAGTSAGGGGGGGAAFGGAGAAALLVCCLLAFCYRRKRRQRRERREREAKAAKKAAKEEKMMQANALLQTEGAPESKTSERTTIGFDESVAQSSSTTQDSRRSTGTDFVAAKKLDVSQSFASKIQARPAFTLRTSATQPLSHPIFRAC